MLCIERDEHGDAAIDLDNYGDVSMDRKISVNHQGVINIHFDDRVLPMSLTEWNAVTYFITRLTSGQYDLP